MKFYMKKAFLYIALIVNPGVTSKELNKEGRKKMLIVAKCIGLASKPNVDKMNSLCCRIGSKVFYVKRGIDKADKERWWYATNEVNFFDEIIGRYILVETDKFSKKGFPHKPALHHILTYDEERAMYIDEA